jgi:hypothetical protein
LNFPEGSGWCAFLEMAEFGRPVVPAVLAEKLDLEEGRIPVLRHFFGLKFFPKSG